MKLLARRMQGADGEGVSLRRDFSTAADVRENFNRRVTGHETARIFLVHPTKQLLPVMNHSG